MTGWMHRIGERPGGAAGALAFARVRVRAWARRAAGTVMALTLAGGLAGCDTLPLWMVRQQRSAITDYQHFDNAPVARAAQPSPLPEAPAELRWPAQAGADPAAWLAERDTVALLVLRRGQLVHERYFNGYARDSVFTSFSMAKSVVSALLGIAIAEGRIAGIDEPVTRWLPELRGNDPRFDRITLAHLLRMRSGIAFDEGYGSPFAEAARFYLSPDIPREVARLRIAREPDQAYAYSSGDTQLLAMALQRAVGMPLAAWLQSRLWQPMGAGFDASWSLDSTRSGVARAFCCLNARAVDYLRFGQVFLNEGRASDGRVIVPADWVRASTAAQAGLPGATDEAQRNIQRWGPGPYRAAFYGLQWRRMADRSAPGPLPQPGGAFYAQGLHGQLLWVSPAAQTVVLRLGRAQGGVDWAGFAAELVRLNP